MPCGRPPVGDVCVYQVAEWALEVVSEPAPAVNGVLEGLL